MIDEKKLIAFLKKCGDKEMNKYKIFDDEMSCGAMHAYDNVVDYVMEQPKVGEIMTKEETIKTIKTAIAEVEWNYPMDYTVAFEMAIETLEKQIPKKPLDCADFAGNKYKICLCCSAIVKDGEWRAYYCPDCGQAIKWESEENDDKF